MSDSNDSQLPDLRYVRQLAKVFRRYDLGELEIEAGGQRILLRKQDLTTAALAPSAAPMVYQPAPHVQASASTPAAVAASTAAAGEQAQYITCPFVGTFYRSSSPTSEAFVKVGDTVQVGQTICIVEAMKLFNEIEAEFPCVIEEVLKESGQPVEFGTNLFRVRRL